MKLLANDMLDDLRLERHVRHRPVVCSVYGVKSRPLQERGDDCVFLCLAVGLDAAMNSPCLSRKVGVRRRTRATGTSALCRAYLT